VTTRCSRSSGPCRVRTPTACAAPRRTRRTRGCARRSAAAWAGRFPHRVWPGVALCVEHRGGRAAIGSRRGAGSTVIHRSLSTPSGTCLVVVLEQRPQPFALTRPGDVVPHHARPVRAMSSRTWASRSRIVTARDRVEHFGNRPHRPIVEGGVEPARVVHAEAHSAPRTASLNSPTTSRRQFQPAR